MTEPMPMPPPETAVEHTDNRPKSKGEKIFDWTVYGLMNYAGTFLLTMPLAYFIKHGAGKNWYDKIDRGAEELGLHKGFGGNIVKALQSTFITFWGGNVMLVPVRLAENFKVGIVTKLNEWLGDKTDPSQIQEAPKQTWGTLIGGRLVAFFMTFSMMFAADMMIGKYFQQLQELGGNLFKRFAKPKNAQKAYHYGEIAALDSFATVASTALLYVTSHFFAQKREEKIERKLASKSGTHADEAELETAPAEKSPPLQPAQPPLQLHGERAHEGMAQQAALVPQVS